MEEIYLFVIMILGILAGIGAAYFGITEREKAGGFDDGNQVPELESLINEQSHDQGIDHRHGRTFGHREGPGDDAAEDEDRHEQGEEGVFERLPDFAEAGGGDSADSCVLGDDVGNHHHHQAVGHSRKPPRQKKPKRWTRRSAPRIR